MARTREQWTHPPVVAQEAPSATVARWRFRVLATLLLVALAVGVLLLFLTFSGVTAEDPGLGVGLGAPATALQVPAAA